jgi:putative membrane protein
MARLVDFSHNKLLHVIILVFISFWGIMAVSPTDRKLWFLENILTILLFIFLWFTYKKFHFSNSAYIMIFVFLCLHTYAAHYTYQGTPIDMWLKTTLHTHRSYFDRFVHLAYGLLVVYPFREVLTRLTALRGFWLFTTPIAYILSLSAIFEIIEMIVAILAGQVGQEYVGLQGDMFDSEKDMGLAFVGAVISSIIFVVIASKNRKKAVSVR